MALQLSFFLLLFQVRMLISAIPSVAHSSLPCFYFWSGGDCEQHHHVLWEKLYCCQGAYSREPPLWVFPEQVEMYLPACLLLCDLCICF